MALRGYEKHSSCDSATTAACFFASLVGALLGPVAGVASQQWEAGPFPSVVVESGDSAGGISFAGDVGGDQPVEGSFGETVYAGMPADESVALAGDGYCAACSGAGCLECSKSAIFDLARGHGKDMCWIGRADALILWRNAPPGPTLVTNELVPGGALNASGMDSTPAAGPRFSIFRMNKCTGNGIEATYLRAANFRSLRPLGVLSSFPYSIPAPGIYGQQSFFDSANADLGARLQSFEFNRHHCMTRNLRFLAGFRWIEWQEQFSMQTYAGGAAAEYFQTNCFNDLYGGQIGLDANLLATRWIRFDSVVKAGAYYNVGAQTSQYTTGGDTASVSADDSPLSGAFAGEVGLTGVVPLTCCLDVRFGYFGLWLSGIAQPTQQLAGQQLTPGQPAVGTINSNGGVLVQGASIGLEGRW